MDFDYLLWLQDLRLSAPPLVQGVFSFMGSEAAMAVAMAIPCYVYWCLDRECGQFALLSYGSSTMFNQLVKNTACVYRPWVRNTRLVPDSVALTGAGGYSFPSGHVQSTASTLGAIGWKYRRRWVIMSAALFTVLVGFSRNILGVHTPQDVLVGLLEGCAFVALTSRVLPWIEAREGRDLYVTLGGAAATLLYLVFVTLKPYPMDYVGGQLLVDPAEMLVSCYKAGGAFLGILLGWFAERRYVRFQTGGLSWKECAVRMIAGAAVTFCVYKLVGGAAVALLGRNVGQLVKYGSAFFTATAVAPALFDRLHGLLSRKARLSSAR